MYYRKLISIAIRVISITHHMMPNHTESRDNATDRTTLFHITLRYGTISTLHDAVMILYIHQIMQYNVGCQSYAIQYVTWYHTKPTSCRIINSTIPTPYDTDIYMTIVFSSLYIMKSALEEIDKLKPQLGADVFREDERVLRLMLQAARQGHTIDLTAHQRRHQEQQGARQTMSWHSVGFPAADEEPAQVTGDEASCP